MLFVRNEAEQKRKKTSPKIEQLQKKTGFLVFLNHPDQHNQACETTTSCLHRQQNNEGCRAECTKNVSNTKTCAVVYEVFSFKF